MDTPEHSPATANTPPIATDFDSVFARLQADRAPASEADKVPEPERDEGDPETNNEAPEEGADDSPGQDAAPEEESADDAQPEEDEQPRYRVKVGGQELEVTQDELLKGYQRQADYTRKAQALADDRRAVEKRQQEIAAESAKQAEAHKAYLEKTDQYQQVLGHLQAQLDVEGQEWARVDWDRLEAEDPIEASKLWRKYQRHEQKTQAAQAEQARVAQERATEAEKAKAARVASLQAEISTAFPHWSDASARAADLSGMEEVAKSMGYSDDDLKNTLDPRAFRLLWEAAQYRRLKDARQSAVAGKQQPAPSAPRPQAVKVVSPTAARPTPRTARATEVSALAGRAMRTGSIQDVLALQRAQSQNKR